MERIVELGQENCKVGRQAGGFNVVETSWAKAWRFEMPDVLGDFFSCIESVWLGKWLLSGQEFSLLLQSAFPACWSWRVEDS